MSERKTTPDLLGEILSGADAPAVSPSQPASPPPIPAKPAAPKRRQTKPAPAPPQRWEYMTVRFRDYGGYRPRAVDGQELADWKTQPEILDYLNQLGVQGWELVSLEKHKRYEKEAFLKRITPR